MEEDKIEDAAKDFMEEYPKANVWFDYIRMDAFKSGAKWALENQWHKASEELPECDRDVLVYDEGQYSHYQYRNRKWIFIDGFPCGTKPDGKYIFSSESYDVTFKADYWMYIPNIPNV